MSFLGDILSFIAAPVTTVVPKIIKKPPKILENPYVGGVANYVGAGLLNPGNPFGTVGGALGATQVGLAATDQVSGNKKARDGLIQTINQQNEAFNTAIKNIEERAPADTPLPSPVAVDQTKPLESAPIAEEKAVERAKKRIIRPTRQGRASTILTSPLGLPGDGGDSGQGGKRLLGQ